MVPKRLPLPGQVIETCRLCQQPLDVSLENPRRVCAQCGEINLPTDGEAPIEHAPPPVTTREAAPPAPPVPRPWTPPPPRSTPSFSSGWIALGTLLGLAPAVVGSLAAPLFEAAQQPRGGLMSGLHFLGPTFMTYATGVPLTFVVMLLVIDGSRTRAWGALRWWLLGALVSLPLFFFGVLAVLNVASRF